MPLLLSCCLICLSFCLPWKTLYSFVFMNCIHCWFAYLTSHRFSVSLPGTFFFYWPLRIRISWDAVSEHWLFFLPSCPRMLVQGSDFNYHLPVVPSGGDFAPQGTCGEDVIGCHDWEQVLLAAGREKPGTLLNLQKCTDRQNKNTLHNHRVARPSAKVEKFRSRQSSLNSRLTCMPDFSFIICTGYLTDSSNLTCLKLKSGLALPRKQNQR